MNFDELGQTALDIVQDSLGDAVKTLRQQCTYVSEYLSKAARIISEQDMSSSPTDEELWDDLRKIDGWYSPSWRGYSYERMLSVNAVGWKAEPWIRATLCLLLARHGKKEFRIEGNTFQFLFTSNRHGEQNILLTRNSDEHLETF